MPRTPVVSTHTSAVQLVATLMHAAASTDQAIPCKLCVQGLYTVLQIMKKDTLQLLTKRQHRSTSSETGPLHPSQFRQVGGEAQEPDKGAPNTSAKVNLAINGPELHLQSEVRNARKASNEAIDHAASSAQLNTPDPTSRDGKHLKIIADDCFVALALSLPKNLQDEWHRNIEVRLQNTIAQKLPDAVTSTTVECAMVRSARDTVAVPTILLMCSKAEHEKPIQKIVQKCTYISEEFECKVKVHGTRTCAAGESPMAKASARHDGEFLVERATSETNEHSILFASLVRIHSTHNGGPFAFSTMGGVVTIDSKPYGLTTAHAIQTTQSPPQQIPRRPGYTLLGQVEHAEWPYSHGMGIESPDKSGLDWALIRIHTEGLTCNEFRQPENSQPQHISAYLRNCELDAGEVSVCAGVSGHQRAFLSSNPASVFMAGRIFRVRSLSLERPLVDGDSGSWVVRDGRLCGYIFSRFEKDMTWGYMLPIEPVFDAIAQHWLDRYGKRCSPSVATPSVHIGMNKMALDQPASLRDTTLLAKDEQEQQQKSRQQSLVASPLAAPKRLPIRARIPESSFSRTSTRRLLEDMETRSSLDEDGVSSGYRSTIVSGRLSHSSQGTSVDGEPFDENSVELLVNSPEGVLVPFDPRFNVVARQELSTFFAPGRVFKMISIQSNESSRAEDAPQSSMVPLEDKTYAKVDRYVVVMEARAPQYFSKCLRISKNSDHGAAKSEHVQRQEAIIYTSTEVPVKSDDERKMYKEAIHVIRSADGEELHPYSRINFSRTFLVEHDATVMEIGMVYDVKKLLGYYQNEAEAN